MAATMKDQIKDIVQNAVSSVSTKRVHFLLTQSLGGFPKATSKMAFDLRDELYKEGHIDFDASMSGPLGMYYCRPKAMGQAAGQALHEARLAARHAVDNATDPRRVQIVGQMLNASDEDWVRFMLFFYGYEGE